MTPNFYLQPDLPPHPVDAMDPTPIDLIYMLRYLIDISNMTPSYLFPVNTSHLLPKGNNYYL